MGVAVVTLANTIRRRRFAIEVEARVDLILAVREEELHCRPHVLSDDPAVAAAFSARDRKPMSEVGQRNKSVDNVYRLISEAARVGVRRAVTSEAEEFVGVAEIAAMLEVARNSGLALHAALRLSRTRRATSLGTYLETTRCRDMGRRAPAIEARSAAARVRASVFSPPNGHITPPSDHFCLGGVGSDASKTRRPPRAGVEDLPPTAGRGDDHSELAPPGGARRVARSAPKMTQLRPSFSGTLVVRQESGFDPPPTGLQRHGGER